MAWIKQQTKTVHFKTLDGKNWTQADGCPIGKSRPGEIAELYMDWFKGNYVYREQNDFQINVLEKNGRWCCLNWKKGAADLYRQMGSDDLYQFLLKLNGYGKRKQLKLQ